MPDPSVDLLLAHARWVEGFARALVSEDSDDVAQDAWIAAIQHPPAPAASPRPWLATVMKNVARMRFRGAARRRAREDGIEPPAATLTPAELTHRMELQRRLASAVLALEEPQRSTVVLVFYEGLSPAEVARRLDVPATTVRSRLRAALVTLRERLDAEEGGDRPRWKLALAPIAASASVPTAPLLALALAALAITTTVTILVVVLPREAPSVPSPVTTVTGPAASPQRPPTAAPAIALPVIDAAPEDEAADPPSTITPAFIRAQKTLLSHLDECYELAHKAGRDVRGIVEIEVQLATRPHVTADVMLKRGTTIEDPDTLECVRENTTAIEAHLEQLREQGEVIEGPITIHVTRAMPPPPRKPDAWPADDASPPCPPGTRVAGKLREHQWCEQADGRKHGPTYTWDAQGRLTLISAYEHGEQVNSVRMRDPDSP